MVKQGKLTNIRSTNLNYNKQLITEMNIQPYSHGLHQQQLYYPPNTAPIYAQPYNTTQQNPNINVYITTNNDLKQRPSFSHSKGIPSSHVQMQANRYKTEGFSQFPNKQDNMQPANGHAPNIPTINLGRHSESDRKYSSEIEKLTKICEQFFHENQKLKEKINYQSHRIEQNWGRKVSQLENELHKYRQIVEQRNKTIRQLNSKNTNHSHLSTKTQQNMYIVGNSIQNSNLSYIQAYNYGTSLYNSQHNNEHTAHKIIARQPNDITNNIMASQWSMNRTDLLVQQLRNKDRQLAKYMQKEQKYIQIYVQKQQLEREIRQLKNMLQSQNKEISQYRRSFDKSVTPFYTYSHGEQSYANTNKQNKLKRSYQQNSYETSSSVGNTVSQNGHPNSFKNNMNMNMHIIVNDSQPDYKQLEQKIEKITSYNNKLTQMLKMSSVQLERLNNLLKNKIQEIQSSKNTIQSLKTTIQDYNKVIYQQQLEISGFRQLQVEHQQLKNISQHFKSQLNNHNPNNLNDYDAKLGKYQENHDAEVQRNFKTQRMAQQSIKQLNRCQQCWHFQQRSDSQQKRIQEVQQILLSKSQRLTQLQKQIEQAKQQNRNLEFRLKEQVNICWELKEMMIKMDQLNKSSFTPNVDQAVVDSSKQIQQASNQSHSSNSKDEQNQNNVQKEDNLMRQVQKKLTYSQQQNAQHVDDLKLPDESGKVEDRVIEQKNRLIEQLERMLQSNQQRIKSLKQENKQLSDFTMKQNSSLVTAKENVKLLQAQKKQLLHKLQKFSQLANNFNIQEIPALLKRLNHAQSKLQSITKHYHKLLDEVQSSVSQTESVHKQIEQILEAKNQFIIRDLQLQLDIQPKVKGCPINTQSMSNMRQQQRAMGFRHGQSFNSSRIDRKDQNPLQAIITDYRRQKQNPSQNNQYQDIK